MNDLKFAFRQLLKNPGFTAVAVLTLGLGIGANTAIFSVVNAVLLRPLPYPAPDRLVMLFERNPQRGIDQQPVSPANFEEWQRQNSVFQGMGFWRGDEPVNLVRPEGTEKVQGAFVSSTMLDLLGARPLLGRLILPEEGRLRGPLAAVLSHKLWQERFGADANVLGKTLTVDGNGEAKYTIAGVLPPGFRFPGETELWLSWSGLSRNRVGATRLSVVARLKPGITLERARLEMSALQARLPQTAREIQGSEVAVVPLLEQLVGRNMKLALLVLWGVVAGVLLIACFNVANLLLARAADRQKEIALRFALGASRWRLIRQLLTESVLLALLGGALGVLLGKWGLQLLLAASPVNVARLQEVTLDGPALLFTLLICLVTGILFGLAPAWQFIRTDLNERLKEDNRGTSAGRTSTRVRNSLVVAEVALSLVLLIGAGLMLQSFVRLLRAERGIKPEHVLTARLDFSVRGFTTWAEATDSRPQMRLEELLQRLQSQPGVQAVGATSWLPRSNTGPPKEPIVILGRASDGSNVSPTADHSGVTPDYFRAMGVPLLRGRFFTEADQLDTQPVFIINETLARRYFGNEDPIGKRLAFASRTNRWAPAEYYHNKFPEIVGVVADVSTLTQNPEVHPHFYSPYWQYPMQSPVVAVRVATDPAVFAPVIRREVKAVAPNLPAPVIQTMNTILAQTVAQPRFQAWMLSVFGTIALGLAAIGLYGVLAYTVTQRQREIGVRMALGAQPRDVLGLVVGHGMKLVLVGAAIGLLGAFALTRVLRRLLFEVQPGDPLTFLAVSGILAGVALLACWLPARRASRIDPMNALRHE